jgi:predicted nucleic acid-binding protein
VSTWVSNAGPLIFLAKLDRLNLLQDSGEVIYLPAAVMVEIQAKSDAASFAIEQASKTWLQVRQVEQRGEVELLLADMDLGEAEVIVLARETHASRVLLDDLDARRFARRIGLAPVGTLGLLLSARLKGEIQSLDAEIVRLQELGFWVSDDLREEVLKAAGEGSAGN